VEPALLFVVILQLWNPRANFEPKYLRNHYIEWPKNWKAIWTLVSSIVRHGQEVQPTNHARAIFANTFFVKNFVSPKGRGLGEFWDRQGMGFYLVRTHLKGFCVTPNIQGEKWFQSHNFFWKKKYYFVLIKTKACLRQAKNNLTRTTCHSEPAMQKLNSWGFDLIVVFVLMATRGRWIRTTRQLHLYRIEICTPDPWSSSTPCDECKLKRAEAPAPTSLWLVLVYSEHPRRYSYRPTV